MGAKRNLHKVPPDHPHAKYSGNASNNFWRRINRLKDPKMRTMCFELGCALQDVEYRVLAAITVAEKKVR